MPFYADLHIHSKYSRATAKSCDLEHLALWARKKGIAVLGTGDFTHPGWMAELREGLVAAEPGLWRLRDELERHVQEQTHDSAAHATRFQLSVEISTIYKKGERTRKVHHVICAADFEAAERLTNKLATIGNLASDGRPILGLDSRDLLEIALESGEHSYLVPAHIWTPWFSALGSKSGFDSIDECYGDLSEHIFAVETGLSSDPAMNWRVGSLDRFRLVSSSDAHSPPMLAREACLFDGDCDYFGIRRALETGEGYLGTVEFFPEEGKYHLDGHRNCDVRLSPAQTRELGGRCPTCGRQVTVGVMHRVEELADRDEASVERPPTGGEVRSLVPLREVLSELRGVGPKSKTVGRSYERLLGELGPELYILHDAPLEDVRRASSSLLAEALERLRQGRVIRQAGYDGAYGVIRLFEKEELEGRTSGGLLFELPPPSRSASERPHKASGKPAPPTDERASPAAELPLATTASEPSAPPARTLPLFAAGEAAGADHPNPILAALDADQRAAAEHAAGPLLIVAGPGSGKTRTLTHRIAYLVSHHEIEPSRCLAITFTRRAASEMRERLQALLPSAWESIEVCTFHRLGLSVLREHGERVGIEPGFRIADELERSELLARALQIAEKKARRLLAAISRHKRSDAAAVNAELGEALECYRQQMRAQNLLDYDDLVELAVEVLSSDDELCSRWRERFPWLSIDEYQDVDEQQYRLVRLLAPPDGNVCAIGDPDQAIYGFRGADVRFFGRFEEDFPGARRVQLRRNYRSGRPIVEASGQVIARSDGVARASQALVDSPQLITIHQAATDRAEAEFVVHAIEQMMGGHTFFSVDSRRSDGTEQADWSFSDFAVLYRTEAQSALLGEALARSGMPFRALSHRGILDQPAARDLVERLRELPPSGSVLARLQSAASRALSEAEAKAEQPAPIGAAMALLEPLAAAAGSDLDGWLATLALGTEADGWDPRADSISLLTLHAAKGLEFPVVFLVGCEDGILPLVWGKASETDLGEERRLCYVGMTRARQRLLLCWARKRQWRGKVRAREMSPFLRDIEQQLLEHSATRARPAKAEPAADQLELF